VYNNCPKCGSYNSPGTSFCDCGYPLNPEPYLKTQVRTRQERGLFLAFKYSALILMAVSAVVFLVSFPLRNGWPSQEDILQETYQAPIQDRTDLPEPFVVDREGVSYNITPRFNYELFGLVVSQHRSDSLTDVLHEQWNDFLNIKDICVVWGSNIETQVFRDVTFSSGNFTCFCKWKTADIGRRFSGTALSNNHLLANDQAIARAILETHIGDQVYLKGFLCKYENPAVGFSRDTSTVRNDTGNGACETIYVTHYSVLKPMNPLFHILFTLSWIIFLIGLLMFFSLAFLFPSQK